MASPKTTVLNLRDLPKRLSNPLYIGRGSYWGNPYTIGKDGDRETVLAKYKRRLWADKAMMARLPELKGKQLLCFCSPQRCHGHVLAAALAWSESVPNVAKILNSVGPTADEIAAHRAKKAAEIDAARAKRRAAMADEEALRIASAEAAGLL
jgi:hypothetical protein